jgi:hypothetical protein
MGDDPGTTSIPDPGAFLKTNLVPERLFSRTVAENTAFRGTATLL